MMSGRKSEDYIDSFRDFLARTEPTWRRVVKRESLPRPLPQFVVGCGDMGCVFQTEQPGIVLKVTTSPSEAALGDLLLSKTYVTPGFVAVLGVKVIKIAPLNPHRDLEEWGALIWREWLPLLVRPSDVSKAARSALKAYGEAMAIDDIFSLHKAVDDRDVSSIDSWEVDALKKRLKVVLPEMKKSRELNGLARSLELSAKDDTFIDDIRIQNMGRRIGSPELIVFDALCLDIGHLRRGGR